MQHLQATVVAVNMKKNNYKLLRRKLISGVLSDERSELRNRMQTKREVHWGRREVQNNLFLSNT